MLFLVKSVTSVPTIARELELDKDTVENDIKWIRKQAQPWLTGLALEGFIADAKLAVDQLKDIELELQSMRTDENLKKTPFTRLKVLSELKDTIAMRIELEGNGPTLMSMRKIREEAGQHGKKTH